MIEKFQCPGCVNGCDTQCGQYNYDKDRHSCSAHVLGTQIGFGNLVAIGLPKGFNKPGFNERDRAMSKMNIRFFKQTIPEWDKLNIPVWAMEKDGFLFVRTYCPRINVCFVDVIEGGTLSMVPGTINVGDFIDEID
jgi:hypothetical protein